MAPMDPLSPRGPRRLAVACPEGRALAEPWPTTSATSTANGRGRCEPQPGGAAGGAAAPLTAAVGNQKTAVAEPTPALRQHGGRRQPAALAASPARDVAAAPTRPIADGDPGQGRQRDGRLGRGHRRGLPGRVAAAAGRAAQARAAFARVRVRAEAAGDPHRGRGHGQAHAVLTGFWRRVPRRGVGVWSRRQHGRLLLQLLRLPHQRGILQILGRLPNRHGHPAGLLCLRRPLLRTLHVLHQRGLHGLRRLLLPPIGPVAALGRALQGPGRQRVPESHGRRRWDQIQIFATVIIASLPVDVLFM